MKSTVQESITCFDINVYFTENQNQALVVQNPANFIHWVSPYPLPTDTFGEIFAQSNDSYTFTSVLYKIHTAMFSFLYVYFICWIAAYPADNAIHPLNNWALPDCMENVNKFITLG